MNIKSLCESIKSYLTLEAKGLVWTVVHSTKLKDIENAFEEKKIRDKKWTFPSVEVILTDKYKDVDDAVTALPKEQVQPAAVAIAFRNNDLTVIGGIPEK